MEDHTWEILFISLIMFSFKSNQDVLHDEQKVLLPFLFGIPFYNIKNEDYQILNLNFINFKFKFSILEMHFNYTIKIKNVKI